MNSMLPTHAAGQTTLNPQTLATLRNRYRGALAKAITDNSARADPLATTHWL